MKKTLFFTILFSLSITLFSCDQTKLPVKDIKIINSEKETIIVKAEIAIKPEDQQKGYMERENIPQGTGMLFVFQHSRILSFWMKNTPSPLSIAYIDSTGKICDIYDMTPYSLDSIVSTVPVKYALEVPQGWFTKRNINTGDYVDVSYFEKSF